MRRLGALWIMIVVLFAAGCRPQHNDPQPVAADFICDIRATYRQLTVAGTLTRHSAGTLQLSFSEPETLDGLSILWDGDTVTLSMYGLSFSTDPKDIPESALGQELITVFDDALRGEFTARKGTDGTIIMEGSTPSGSYSLVCDGDSGKPLSLSLPDLPLTATFSNYRDGEES